MSNEAHNKRPRTDYELASSVIPPAALQQHVASLPPASVAVVLQQILAAHPEVHATFSNLRNGVLHAEAERKRLAPLKSFGDLVSKCEYEINDKYARLRPSQQYDIVGDIGEVISDAVEEIRTACREDGRAGTQLNGLKAMAEIARDMLNCEHGEIQKGLMHDVSSVADSIESLFHSLAAETQKGPEAAAIKDDLKDLASELLEYGIECFDDLISNNGEDDDEDED